MTLALAAVLLATLQAPQEEHQHTASPAEKLGTVHFASSCSAAAQPQLDRAVALLHSFEFGPATAAFEATGKTDPACVITAWGVALAAWGNPFAAGQKTPAQVQRGHDVVEAALRTSDGSERERGYVGAVAELFRDAEHRDQATRVGAYRDAMGVLSARHPEDMEASIFYALALAQAVPATDKTYADLLKAGAILEQLVADHPDHPGLAHYIIHSYDVPALAPKALAAARRYAKIAPSAPHALHMPSHTFTRLGLWQESIDTNIASAAAARRDGATSEELHASDYQMYAYLQTGQDAAARRLLDALPEIAARFGEGAPGSAAPPMAGFFALAAIPARWALERQQWGEAARLEPHPGRYPQTEAMTLFARALGAVHVRDLPAAKAAIDALQPIHDRLVAAGESYWAGQVEIQQRGSRAWLALAEGRKDEALAAMRAAAEMEDQTEKNAVTPGPLAPARELLGEMLLEVQRPADALPEFEATLRKEPDRYRALAGAARAAVAAGDRTAATRHYQRLLSVCAGADKPGREELDQARKWASALPGWFLGTWRREWIRRGGVTQSNKTVRFLQTPTMFGDLRIPTARPGFPHAKSLADLSDAELASLFEQQGFFGYTTVEGSTATWHHEIDYQPPDGDVDSGRLERLGANSMYEHALDGSYTEHWWSLGSGDEKFLVVRVMSGERLDRVLLVAGDHFVYARNRRRDLPPAASFTELIAKSHATRAQILEYLDCELSHGAVRGGRIPWEIAQSTLPWREGQHLELPDAISVDDAGSLSGRGAVGEVWSFPVNTMRAEDLRVLFAPRRE